MEIIKIYFDPENNLQIFVNIWVVILCAVFLFIWFLRFFLEFIGQFKSIEIDQLELGIGSQKISIRPNYTDMQIAYKLWVEINTRKIGLPLDFDNDVIVEVYNSWYEFFKITRELLKEIPISKIYKSKDTQRIVTIAIQVLNLGLRPHLSVWQAKFRKWFDTQIELKKNKNLSPQDVQKKYEHYESLKNDMNKVNEKLINYRIELKKIAKIQY